MCGIFCVIERRRPVEPDDVRRATDTLAHRGPDASGVHVASQVIAGPNGNYTASLGFGHRRLSIIDLDPRSNQPFVTAAGALVYNGEIYDFADARHRFLAGEPVFETSGDTEVLHRLLSRYGDARLSALNGMWAFCFHDAPRQRVIASRDRYGKKPLFYYADENVVCFASEMKAIFSYLRTNGRARHGDVATFLAQGMLLPRPDDLTFIDSIRQVRAGHTLELDLRTWSIAVRPYIDFDALVSGGEQGDLADLVGSAVLSRLVSDRPVGLLLSGGIDSSLILSVLAASGALDRVHCFIGDTGTSDDAEYARECAREVNVSAQLVHCDYGAAAFDRILTLCDHHEKPFPLNGNAVAMCEMYEQIGAAGVPVVLDGTGGDEVFGGYWERYYKYAVRDAIQTVDRAWLEPSLAAAQNDPETKKIADAAVSFASRPAEDAAPRRALPPGASEAVRSARSDDPLLNHSGDFTSALATDASRGRLAEWIWHNDRNAMMFGVENRSPFLDWRLIPFIRSGYARKMVGEWNKHELRKLYDAFRPLPTQWRRQKQGFRWTQGRFLEENRTRVLDLLAGSRILPDFIDMPSYVDKAKQNDATLKSGVTSRLLSIAGLESKMRLQGTT